MRTIIQRTQVPVRLQGELLFARTRVLIPHRASVKNAA